MELYEERLKTSGKKKADLKFVVDVLLLFRPGIIRNAEISNPLNQYDMFKNYFKVSIRNILKYKTFSFINVFGLAVAMSASLLVILMLADQYRYDQFHEKKERVFRILSERPYSSTPFASTPAGLTNVLSDNYPIIEQATHLVVGVGGDATYNQTTAEMRGFFADAHFFQVFDFELEKGNKANALQSPNSMVISSKLAQQLFKHENPLGKTVEFNDRGLHYLKSGKDSEPVPWGSFIISGVLSDKNSKSHLKFDVLISSSSQQVLSKENKFDEGTDHWDKAYTYVLLAPGSNHQDLTVSLQDAFKRAYAQNESLKDFQLTAQPLTEITPGVMVNQPPSYQLPIASYYFFGFIMFGFSVPLVFW